LTIAAIKDAIICVAEEFELADRSHHTYNVLVFFMESNMSQIHKGMIFTIFKIAFAKFL